MFYSGLFTSIIPYLIIALAYICYLGANVLNKPVPSDLGDKAVMDCVCSGAQTTENDYHADFYLQQVSLHHKCFTTSRHQPVIPDYPVKWLFPCYSIIRSGGIMNGSVFSRPPPEDLLC